MISGAGSYIGGGTTVDYDNPVVSISASYISADAGGWQVQLSAPAGQTLAPGTYPGATRYPFNTGTAPGLTVSGNGAGCNQDFGTFTIYELTATSLNATFTQTCESTTAPPVEGFVRYNATTTTPVPTLPSSAQPITPPPNSGTTSANADEFSFLSAPGDYIGGGSSVDVVGTPAVSAGGSLSEAQADAGGWTLNLAAPAGEQLVPGTYTGATRTPFNTGTEPGLTLTGDGRGCNQDFGTFTIYEIAADSTGKLTKLNATFNQTCESTTAPPLAGFIRFNATEPTPVPTVPTPPPPPAPLIAALIPSTGSATTAGMTNVTLDASGTSGAGTGASYSFDFGDGTAPLVSPNPVVTRPEWEGTYQVGVTVTDSLGRTSTSTPQWLTVGDGYQAVTPTRLLDTRVGTGAPTGPVKSMQSVTLQLPSSVTASSHGPLEAVVLNVTVTQPTAIGDVKVYPNGLAQQPTTSNLNFAAGETVANLVTVPVGADGQIILRLESPGSAQLIADLEGYYTAGNDPTDSGFAPLSPTRIMDTRNGTGGVGGRVGSDQRVVLPVPASVPADATAVVLNVTAVNTASYGDLKVYPDGVGGVPNVSNLNFAAGGIVPNLVIVPIAPDRKIDFYLESPGPADLIADLEGYFSPSAPSRFVPAYPTRIFDTRNGDAGGIVPAYGGIQVSLAGGLQVPVSALTAALFNVTVTEPQGPGVIVVFPDGLSSIPNVSNLNFVKNQTVANSVLSPITDGDVVFLNDSNVATQLISDFFGYFAKPLTFDPPPSATKKMAHAITAK
jgi:PKD domain